MGTISFSCRDPMPGSPVFAATVAVLTICNTAAHAQLQAPTENCNKQGYCYGQKFIPCYQKIGCAGGAWFRAPVDGRTCYPRYNLKKPGLVKYWCFDSF